jgi:hypothetical protein
MKIATAFLTGAAVLAMAQGAHAAVLSIVSGKYAFQEIDLCEATIKGVQEIVLAPGAVPPNTLQVPAVKNLNLLKSGLIAVGVGYITFTPLTATSGNAGATFISVEGGAVRVISPTVPQGYAMNKKPSQAFAATWSINSATAPTTFTLTPPGGPAQTWDITYGNVVSGVARTIYLVRVDAVNGDNNPNCLQAITATRR